MQLMHKSIITWKCETRNRLCSQSIQIEIDELKIKINMNQKEWSGNNSVL